MEQKKRVLRFQWLCALVYFTCYLTRYNYGATMAEIIRAMGATKAAVSLAVTLCFASYGVGQLISGVLGDHISPRVMIFAGLGVSSLCNLGVALFPQLPMMTAFWLVNGFAQAMVWPPLVRIMSEYLESAAYQKAATAVSVAASTGTVTIYLMVPACISLAGWRLAFAVPAVLGIGISLLWFFGVARLTAKMPRVVKEEPTDNGKPNRAPIGRLILDAGLLPMMAAIVLHGILRDGVSTWTPTMISDVFQMDTAVSILTSVVLPIFSILSLTAVNAVNRKVKNEVGSATIFFAVALAAALLLLPLYNRSPIASVVLLAILSGAMHGTNLMLISHVCAKFVSFGRASFISGLMNAFTYIGSAASTYGIAAIATRWGWPQTITLWICVALAGGLLCASVIRRWHRFEDNLQK